MTRAIQNESAAQHATRLIEHKDIIIRTAEEIRIGIHPRVFYELRNSGVLKRVSQGVCRLAEQKLLSNLNFVTVALQIPKAVICLVSALVFHGITTHIMHTVSIALDGNAEAPKIEYPPISVHSLSGESLTVGVENRKINGVTIRIYSREKILVDCFMFQNKVRMEVMLEVLKLYKNHSVFKLLEYARICRVEKIIKIIMKHT